jgi:putative aminopeptidase FrvX
MRKNLMINKESPMLKIGKSQLRLLETLSNANGVSGDEGEIRAIIRKEITPFTDEIKVDAMGNLLALKKAKTAKPVRVLIAAHMDEVGFMIVDEESDGLFSFAMVGGMDERQLLAKTVVVGKDKIPGIIGSKPIHLLESGEIHTTVRVQSMRIDVAPANSARVKVGDYAAFSTKFKQVGSTFFGKALDDRLGVAGLIELIKTVPDTVELLAAFTVQEELGLRGARVAAYNFNPDFAFALDSTPAIDLPRPDGEENTQYNCHLDAGPAIYLADAGTISDPRLVRFLTKTAIENHIPFQFRQPGGGGTDAGALHKTRAGISTISVSIPGRYAHTPIMMARLHDWENTIRLLQKTLETLSLDLLAVDRS